MKDAYIVSYAPQALEDLKGIYAYIAFELQASVTGKKLVNQIRKEIRSLDHMPLRYPIVDWEPWHSLHMHKLPVGHFVVFYTVETAAKTVMIIRIVYDGRDIMRIMEEDALD